MQAFLELLLEIIELLVEFFHLLLILVEQLSLAHLIRLICGIDRLLAFIIFLCQFCQKLTEILTYLILMTIIFLNVSGCIA